MEAGTPRSMRAFNINKAPLAFCQKCTLSSSDAQAPDVPSVLIMWVAVCTIPSVIRRFLFRVLHTAEHERSRDWWHRSSAVACLQPQANRLPDLLPLLPLTPAGCGLVFFTSTEDRWLRHHPTSADTDSKLWLTQTVDSALCVLTSGEFPGRIWGGSGRAVFHGGGCGSRGAEPEHPM